MEKTTVVIFVLAISGIGLIAASSIQEKKSPWELLKYEVSLRTGREAAKERLKQRKLDYQLKVQKAENTAQSIRMSEEKTPSLEAFMQKAHNESLQIEQLEQQSRNIDLEFEKEYGEKL